MILFRSFLFRTASIALCLPCMVALGADIEETEAGPGVEAAIVVDTHMVTAGPDARPQLVPPVVKKKTQAVIAGNALFFAGAAIQYGLIVPKSRQLGPYDLEDQLALLSPSLLATGLRYAGPPMACMRTSEVADAYRKYMATAAPKNLSWKLYFSGWGFTLASSALSAGGIALTYLEYEEEAAVLMAGAQYVAIAADVAWAVASIYSFFYLRRIDETARIAQQKRASVAPLIGRDGATGLALKLNF